MYPLKFINLYYEKIWGGRDLELFRDNLPEGNIGETWDVACHKNGMSIVSNGELKGKSLKNLIKEYKDDLLGTKINKDRFPLLVKLINAREPLSIQVHPENDYAKRVEGDLGKTEAWYVVEAFEGANLIIGAKEGVTKEDIKKGLKNGDIEKYLNKVEVKKGDVYFVKSGLIHAIGGGVVIAEIQQNSDTTYRVYDYDRGREIHVKKALDVINLELSSKKRKGLKVSRKGYDKIYLCLCEEFSLELYDIKEKAVECSDKERFFIFTCVDGEGTIVSDEAEEKINKGDSILIPASLGKYTLKGEMKLLKSYVPDVERVRDEILSEVK